MRRLGAFIALSVLGATGFVFILVYSGMSLVYQRASVLDQEQRTSEMAYSVFSGLYILMEGGANRQSLDQYVAAFRTEESRGFGYRLLVHDVSGRATVDSPSTGPRSADLPADTSVQKVALTGMATSQRTRDLVRVLRPVTMACTSSESRFPWRTWPPRCARRWRAETDRLDGPPASLPYSESMLTRRTIIMSMPMPILMGMCVGVVCAIGR